MEAAPGLRVFAQYRCNRFVDFVSRERLGAAFGELISAIAAS
jgi:hypothetical protein